MSKEFHRMIGGNLKIPTLGLLLLGAASASAQGSISGTVYDSLRTRAPLANATVVLVERSRYATTDSAGKFSIDSVPDGHYTLGFMHPVLDSLDIQAPLTAVDVAGARRATVTLFTPSPSVAYAIICPGPRDADTGVIIGRVRDVDDETSLANATVSTEWTEYTINAGRPAGHRVRATARTNAGGVYLLCGVPKEVPVAVHTELAGFMAGPTPLLPDDRLLRRLDFAVSRQDSAARGMSATDSSKVARALSGTASLRGVVLGGEARPVRDATVGVFGTQLTARTDAAGAFRIDKIPAGTRTIEVKSIGLLPRIFSVDFATNAARDTTLSISRQAQDLAPVTVRERDNSTSLMLRDGFETRRQRGLGTFVTAQDLARHQTTDLTSTLARIRGLHVTPDRFGNSMPYLRGTRETNCIPNYFVDGSPFKVTGPAPPAQQPYTDLTATVRPEAILGIEVYASPGNIPAQYDVMSSTGCGSIVIWTR